MSQIQQEEIPCPFCGIGKILCGYIPESYTIKHIRSGKGRANVPKKSSEQWDVQSGCVNCGKNISEIKRALKEGVPADKEKMKRRYDEIMKLKEEMKKEREGK